MDDSVSFFAISIRTGFGFAIGFAIRFAIGFFYVLIFYALVAKGVATWMKAHWVYEHRLANGTFQKF